MKHIKRTLLRVFFAVEIIVFAGMYLFGAQGLRVIRKLHHDTAQLDQEINHLRTDVATLEHNVVAWQSDHFYQEKIARERLHMARKNDVVYYLD